jgi:hypothetical protein
MFLKKNQTFAARLEKYIINLPKKEAVLLGRPLRRNMLSDQLLIRIFLITRLSPFSNMTE